ncbi:MAG: hypothetical protein ACI802_002793 [Candidatus Paceibacteria bacterium]|jgi:hypothetical protein
MRQIVNHAASINCISNVDARYALRGSQVAWRIHTVMQDTNDCDAISRDLKVNHVPLTISATIARSDEVACRGDLGRRRQFGKGRYQDVDVTIGLLCPPLLPSMGLHAGTLGNFIVGLGRSSFSFFV